MCKQKYVYKEGELMSEILPKLRPFDAVFFKGDAISSQIIKTLGNTKRRTNTQIGFTHVGVVITSEIITHDNILPHKKYIFESIINAKSSKSVKDINGKLFSGVQIRNLEEVIAYRDKSNKTQVAYGILLNNPIDTQPISQLKERFSDFFVKYYMKSYDFNPYSLVSSAYSCLRPCRDVVEAICNTKDFYFCSEIVALLYKHMGVYPETVNEKDVLPIDISYSELDKDGTPKIMKKIILITTPIHYIPKNKGNNVRKIKDRTFGSK
jgi:hypothetical protein